MEGREEVKRLKFWLAAGMLLAVIGLMILFGFAAELGVEPAALRAWIWKYGPIIFVPKTIPIVLILCFWRRLWAYFRRSSKSAD